MVGEGDIVVAAAATIHERARVMVQLLVGTAGDGNRTRTRETQKKRDPKYRRIASGEFRGRADTITVTLDACATALSRERGGRGDAS